MKKNTQKLIARAMAGFVLLGGSFAAKAAEDILVNAFDAEEEVFTWTHWWGAPAWTVSFDPDQDSTGNANSGALKVTVDFDIATHGGDNQFSFLKNLVSEVNGTQYEKLIMDIKYDPSSAARPTGDYGYLEYGIRRNPDWAQNYFGNKTVATTETGWVRLEANLPQTYDGIDKLAGITFKMWAGDGNGDNKLTGTQTFWVDNVQLIAKEDTTPIDPPTLSIEKATSGLNMITSRAGAQYQRQNIRTKDGLYGWVGTSTPVTYSMTLKEFPLDPGYQAHIFLVPGENLPTFETSPDWNRENVIFVQIGANANGSGYANFRYKVNQANGNSMYWNGNPDSGPVGFLGSVGSANVLGTWSVTFKNDTEVTLTSPDGTTTDIALPADHAALFGGPLYAFFGVQPNEVANIGKQAILSGASVTGVEMPINDTFSGDALNTAENWTVVAEDAAGISFVPNEPTWWLKWTLPAPGFVLQGSSDLQTWTTINTPAPQVGELKKALVPESTMRAPAPEGEQGAVLPYAFFRLLQPAPEPPAEP